MKPVIKLVTFWSVFSILTLVFVPYIISVAHAQSCETRGTWLNPEAFNSATRRANTINNLTNAHLNTAFLAAYPLNGNHGWSSQSDFEAMLMLLKQNNFSVHVWLWNHGRTRPTGQYADFTNAEEQQAQARWATDFIKLYEDDPDPDLKLDGVHLDYIRYRDSQAIDSAKLEGVSQTVRIIYNAIQASYPTKKLSAAVFINIPAAASYTSDIPQWFLDWRQNQNPIGQAPNGYSFSSNQVPLSFKYQQDPAPWVNNAFIDSIIIMDYRKDDNDWNRDLNTMLSFTNQNLNKTSMGLGWLVSPNHSNYAYDPAGVVRKIKYGRQVGIKGFVFFQLGDPNITSHGTSDQALVDALTIDSATNNNSAPFKNQVPSCLESAAATSPSPRQSAEPSPSSSPPAGGSPSPSPSPTSPPCFGADNIINADDVTAWATNYLLNPINLDTNRDNRINSFEFGYLVSHWGQACRN